MPLASPSPAIAAPPLRQADVVADVNWRANLAALAATQPQLLSQVEEHQADVTWMYGRDGALTALDAAGGWWAGCSIPSAAAKGMLRNFSGSGATACFLCPPSAAAVRAGLDKLRPHQAIVVIVPDPRAAWVMLHCEHFANDIHAHRVWFTMGDNWESHLATILRENGGLPNPSQFVRLTDGFEELAEAMIDPAQRVFSEITRHRASEIATLLNRATQTATARVTPRVCVIAPSHFRLWDDAGHTLAQIGRQSGWSHVDPDDPACASPLAMARAAAGSDAVIMPNTARADLPNVVAMSTPWITWLTGPRVPAIAAAGPRDLLLVADAAWRHNAITAGWPAARVHVATWPEARRAKGPAALLAAAGSLLICADVPALEAPKDVVEMSSHRLLWDAIADELVHDPFALGDSILDYLHERMKRLTIAETTLDSRRFIDGVIAPAYARGLAELLKRAGLPIVLAGDGWDQIDTLKLIAAGAVNTREAFDDAVAGCAALVHVWPTLGAHPIHHLARPVVVATAGREALLRNARAAAAGKLAMNPASAISLTAELMTQLIDSVQ